jgi:hypothetical protein
MLVTKSGDISLGATRINEQLLSIREDALVAMIANATLIEPTDFSQ